MGRPSVAFDTGGNSEVIVDGETGCLVPAGDLDALAHALRSLLDDRDRAARLGQRGRERFREKFTHERMVAAYVALFEQLTTTRVA